MHREAMNEPLLYIDQPIFDKPKAFIQMEYYSTEHPVKEKKDEKEDKNATGSFKDLSVAGKINYLTNLPNDAIQMKCEVETKEKTYRGIITNDSDKNIEMRIMGREKKRIDKENITDIRLTGL